MLFVRFVRKPDRRVICPDCPSARRAPEMAAKAQ
jgi:hypothetical protein